MNRRRNDKSNRKNASEVVARAIGDVIIDGYNLMHVTRFKPRNNDDGELRRCREGLLSLLAEHLPPNRYRQVTIVFDSDRAPRNLPDQMRWQHFDVYFARQENSADDLIALMIQQHSAPKNLVVVSSDHRVQVAAQRRKATPLDSDRWFDAVLDHRARLEGADASEQPSATPDSKESDEEFDNPFPEGYFDGLEDEF